MPIKFFFLFLLAFLYGLPSSAQSAINLKYEAESKDTSFLTIAPVLKTVFVNETELYAYLTQLSGLLASKGYPTASVDSVWNIDSLFYARIYIGRAIKLTRLYISEADKKALKASSYLEKEYNNVVLPIKRLYMLKERLVRYYERNGYPFVSVKLDSISFRDDEMSALLKTEKGPFYRVDSIRIFGKVKLSNVFLQRFLQIENGSMYNAAKIAEADKRLADLPFVGKLQPSDVTMLGSGAVLNVYLKPKRSSQFDFLVGVLPSSEAGKLQITGDVNLDLKNIFGGSESLLIKWQQLQIKSPRLNLGFSTPFLFKSKFGFDFMFDLFKKDSSFLQINAQIGTKYLFNANHATKFFMQWQVTSLLAGAVDTALIKSAKKLPDVIDVSALNTGVTYDWNNTNYRFNPRSGNECNLSASVGIKNIKTNNDILSIKDPLFNAKALYDSLKTKQYQLRVRCNFAHYFSVGRAACFKMGFNGGVFISPSTFRNELFQIGGYKLLRGFNEESIFASRYGVFTAEYRLLLQENSYLFFFTDGASVKNQHRNVNTSNTFFSGGMGIVYETKFGLLNIAYGVGKRNDVPFNLREASKLHFGYINYF